MRELLIDAVPDLVAFVQPDGTILDHLGGGRSFHSGKPGTLRGAGLDRLWPEPVVRAVRQMVRGVCATRVAAEAQFRDGDRSLDIRVRPHGRRRALLVVRDAGGEELLGLRDSKVASLKARRIERRGFLKRFQLSIADASLRSQPIAVCMIHLGGLQAIGQALGLQVAEKVATLALDRLRASVAADAADAPWHVGQLGEGLLAGVIEGIEERDAVRERVAAWCRALGEDVHLGDAAFALTACSGISFLGADAARPQILLEQARAAMNEARRAAESSVVLYSEGLKLRPLAGLAAERELRGAIEAGQLRVAYAATMDLRTKRLAALRAELRWRHPERGELRGPQFLPLAHHVGLLPALGRWTFGRLRDDLAVIIATVDPTVRISLVVSRQHLVGGGLLEDVAAVVDSGVLSPARLELRIADRSIAGLEDPRRTLAPLADFGVRLAVDDYGRSFSSLARLAELPLAGLCLDGRIVERLGDDPRAPAICEAALGVARALGLRAAAAGVDAPRQREVLERLGCDEAAGTCFGEITIAAPDRAVVS